MTFCPVSQPQEGDPRKRLECGVEEGCAAVAAAEMRGRRDSPPQQSHPLPPQSPHQELVQSHPLAPPPSLGPPPAPLVAPLAAARPDLEDRSAPIASSFFSFSFYSSSLSSCK